jgi:hypothetical protein
MAGFLLVDAVAPLQGNIIIDVSQLFVLLLFYPVSSMSWSLLALVVIFSLVRFR